jgi:hypothetical protein
VKVYISGPMKAMPDLNRAAFFDCEAMLIDRGYETINPHRLSPARLEDESDECYYERCMQIDLEALKECHAIFMLPAWPISSGAVREFKRAQELGLEVLHA